jgi:hypothetical protein
VNPFVSDFAIYKLGAVLQQNGILNDSALRWYWRSAPHWDAPTQEAFDSLAERRIRERCNRPDSLSYRDFSTFDTAIRQGVRRRTWNSREDAEQEAWLALFERRAFNGRDANVLGQTTARRQTRANREIPISQIASLRPTPDSDPLPLWDYRPRVAGSEENGYYVRLIGDHQNWIRRQIMSQFQKERPEDYAFLIDYLATKRMRAHTAPERRRAKTIIDRLRRIEATERFD